MKRAVSMLGLLVGLSGVFVGEAQAAPVPVAKVERTVSGLATTRLTPSFDASFKEAVGLIAQLHREGNATDKVDAQDLAVTAIHFYMDHHKIDLGSDPDTRKEKAHKLATDVGLVAVLGW